MSLLEDSRIEEYKSIPTPSQVKNNFRLSEMSKQKIISYRKQISDIIHGLDKNNRKLVIIGPCSLHDEKSAIEYAQRLKILHDRYIGKIFIVMRAYPSKPRTNVGWKGLLHDPDLDGSCRIEKGLFLTRKILLSIVEIGLPIATEWLDTIGPQYYSDLVSFGAIGARTTESQIHRELVSGMSMPCGFKNSTSGDVKCVANAILATKASHTFLGCLENGILSLVKTKGNTDTICILRGSDNGPNYEEDCVTKSITTLTSLGGNRHLLIDCSHGNSYKLHTNQSIVLHNIISQIQKGNDLIAGVMIESHLVEGSQKINGNLNKLVYGKSCTDACIGWDETQHLMQFIFDKL